MFANYPFDFFDRAPNLWLVRIYLHVFYVFHVLHIRTRNGRYQWRSFSFFVDIMMDFDGMPVKPDDVSTEPYLQSNLCYAPHTHTHTV